MESHNAKLGVGLFVVYLTLYGGFVGINAFAPESMEATPIAGLNLAVLYGVGLIFFAFVLAMLYGVLCKDARDTPAGTSDSAAMSRSASSADADSSTTT